MNNPHSVRINLRLIIFLCLTAFNCHAIDDISLDLAEIKAQGWLLQGLHVKLADLKHQAQTLTLNIDRLVLPEPLTHVSFVNVFCAKFHLQDNNISCQEGYADIHSAWLDATQKIPFSFIINEKHSELAVKHIKIMGGKVSLATTLTDQQWQLTVTAKQLKLNHVQKLVTLPDFEMNQGRIDFQAKISGRQTSPERLELTLSPQQVTAQSKDYQYASDKLTATIIAHAEYKKGVWQWHSQAAIKSGGFYAKPVFVDVNDLKKPIQISSSGQWQQTKKQLSVSDFSYLHPDSLLLTAHGHLYQQGQTALHDAKVSVLSEHLKTVSKIYLEPYFEAKALAGIKLAGQMRAEFSLVQQRLSDADIHYQTLEITDSAARISMSGGEGHIHWTDKIESNSLSEIKWQHLAVFGLPINQSRLLLYTDATAMFLAQPTALPILGGTLRIQHFDFQWQQSEEPDIHFVGNIEQVSLEKLTTALALMPLAGTITGDIPGVSLRQGQLSLDGELKISLFDGEIRITKLASLGLFSAWPQLSADMDIINLDLNQLTQKFSFGFIEGKLGGYIRNLKMENWQPVTFYAWIGTPDDDHSKHRISQQAVQNIASIGGGGAADVLSRGFLGFFETFAYDKLGMGCYLHDGVCQLMGVQATEQGYYLVKGGGLPQINVIAYNPRVDWPVLLQRLTRLSSTDEIVIE